MSSPFQKKFSEKTPFAMHEGKVHKSLEHRAEEYLGFPQETARARTDEYLGIKEDEDGLKKEQNSFEYGDTARHYLAGDETSRSIQEKLGGFGKTFLGKTIAGIGSNVGGLIHEAQNIASGRPIMESVEDATNNLAGSIGAFLPEKASTKLLDRYKKFAPDGKVKN
jgi:hypothetical protein